MSRDLDLNLPVSNDGKTVRVVFISLPGQLSPVEWARLRNVLDVLEPGLVTDEHAEETNT